MERVNYITRGMSNVSKPTKFRLADISFLILELFDHTYRREVIWYDLDLWPFNRASSWYIVLQNL